MREAGSPTSAAALLLIGLMFAGLATDSASARQTDRETLPRPEGASTAPRNVRFDHPRQTRAITQALAMLQDSNGSMWFADFSGALHRYNGYELEQFVTDPDNENSLSGRSIIGLYESSDGAIWSGTMGGGAARYDPGTGIITRFQRESGNDNSLSSDTVSTFLESQDGYLWIATFEGVDRIDRETGAWSHFRHDTTDAGSLSGRHAMALHQDDDGTMWVGSWGLNKYNADSQTFTRFLPNPAVPEYTGGNWTVAGNWVRLIHEDKEGRMWVGTWNDGLYEFHRDTETFTSHGPRPEDFVPGEVDDLFSIADDPEGGLWLGTEVGLVYFDTESGEKTTYKSDIRDPFSLAGDEIRAVLVDRQGIMWASAMDRGLNRFDRAARPFEHFYPKPGDDNSLLVSDFGVNDIAEGRDRVLWVSSQNVVNRIDRVSGDIVRYQYDANDANGLPQFSGTSVIEDDSGTLWVGGWRSLSRMDPSRPGRFVVFRHDPEDSTSMPRGNAVFSLFEDSQGTLWMGHQGFGMSRLDDPVRGKFTRFPMEDVLRVDTFFEDSDGTFWLGTASQGLFKFDRETETFTNIRNNPDDKASGPTPGQVQSIAECESEPGILWLGIYGGGLNRFDVAAGTFTYWTVQTSDLPDNGSQGVYCDESGRLWISSDAGLSRFDPRTETFKNFDEDDGLQNNVFNNWAHHQSKYTGEMFFGGPNGVNAFFPEDVGDNPYPPQVVLTGMKLFGEAVGVGDDSPLKRLLSDTDHLTLKHNQNDVTFDYVGIHFSNPEENQYAYMLEPYDDHWRTVGTDRRATFTNLDPGEYTLRVRAANSDGVWNEAGASLGITVLPPWWQTIWAYLLYAGLLVGGVVTAARVQRYRLMVKERERTAIEQAELRADAAEAEARALEADNERKRNVELIGDIGRQITSSLDMDTIFDNLYVHVNELMDADAFGVGLYNQELEQIEYRLAIEDGQRYTPYTRDAREANQFPVWCLRNRAPVFINDVATEYSKYVTRYDDSRGKLADGTESKSPKSLIYLPLIAQDRVLGVISVQSFEPNAYTEYDLNILTTLAAYTSIALDNADAYRRLGSTLEKLKSTQAQLVTQEKLASLGQLTAGIAHEIKNPLNFVNNFAEVNSELTDELLEDLTAYPDALAAVESVLDNLSRNAGLIAQHGKRANNIVLSMMEHASEGATELQPTDINKLVAEHVDLACHGKLSRLNDLNVRMERDLSEAAGFIPVVPRDIGRVLLNLVGNAIDAVQDRAVKDGASYEPRMIVRTRRVNGELQIDVEDNGFGIPAEISAKIFEPFFTTKPSGSGTGLGLSLSHDIVTQGHGGTLTVDSEPGRGARFRIALPAR